MKRVSIYLLFGIALVIAVTVADYYLSRLDWIDQYRTKYTFNVERLPDEALLIRSLLHAGYNEDELLRVLDSRMHVSAINFWVLYHDGKVYKKSLDDKEYGLYKFDLKTPDNTILEPAYSYFTLNLDDGFKILVGLRYKQESFFRDAYNGRKGYLYSYIAIFTLAAFLVFVYFFRDIMASLKLLARSGGRSYGKIEAKSRESDMLLRGFSAYEDRALALEKEKDLFTFQVLPSLRSEITSGREPPYEFSCSLVRTDINNFSTIYNEFPVEDFAATINEFFIEVSHIVARYNGLVHEFVGDEVIYYFKDEVCDGNSAAMALSAIHDVNEVAERFSRFTTRERGYAFTVKSSLSHGRLRFGRFVNGFGLAGPPLIESVRVLSQVHEKDGNVIVFEERHLNAISEVAECAPYARVSLKGFVGERQLYTYKDHKPLKALLDAGDPAVLDKTLFYRSDADLVELISWCRQANEPLTGKLLSKVVSNLRNVPVTRSNGIPQQMLLLWLEDKIQVLEDEEHPSEERLRVLSAAVRLVENLVPRSEFTRQFEVILQRALELKDRRVVANALDVLTLFRTEYDPKMSERLISHPDNRVAANALVHEGVRKISPYLLRKARKMLNSGSIVKLSSALYAIGEIAQHHRQKDLVYYQTQIEFHRLIQSLPKYVGHHDISVRRQAFAAARKAGDQQVIANIRERIEGINDPQLPNLSDEAHEHMGAPSPQAAHSERKAA